ncbi:hypothetical protein GEMRC1_002647 [Eukaryota sp. GEM-RC1]
MKDAKQQEVLVEEQKKEEEGKWIEQARRDKERLVQITQLWAQQQAEGKRMGKERKSFVVEEGEDEYQPMNPDLITEMEDRKRTVGQRITRKGGSKMRLKKEESDVDSEVESSQSAEPASFGEEATLSDMEDDLVPKSKKSRIKDEDD